MRLHLLLAILKLTAAQQSSSPVNYTTLGSACTQASCVAQGHFPCSGNYFYVNNDWVIANTAMCGYDYNANIVPDFYLKVSTPNAISATLTLTGYIDISYSQTFPVISTFDSYPNWNVDIFNFNTFYNNYIVKCTSNCNGAPYGYSAPDGSYFKLNYTVTIPHNTFYIAFATGDGRDTLSWLNVSYSWTFNCTPCSPGLYPTASCGGSSPGTCSPCNNKI